MRRELIIGMFFTIMLAHKQTAMAQSMHFSQYFNAPLLLNPANTALMPDNDFRVGANYRNQWAVLPVPYNTMSFFGDLKIGGNREGEHPNWVGIGGAIFNDKAGSGSLSLLQLQGSLAYHMHLSAHSMLSIGGSYSSVQRSVNYDDLTFDAQWDGFSFNSRQQNGESKGLMKTSFTSIAAGINLAYFPNDAVYVKVGTSVLNANTPTESFYNKDNKIGIRPIGNIDVLWKSSPSFIINPSAYYTTQNGATEIVLGALTRTNIGGSRDKVSSQVLLGGYMRLNDAVIGVAGYQYGGIQFTANYDFTVSTLAPYNGSYGALEFSVIYGGEFYKNRGKARMYSCPRF